MDRTVVAQRDPAEQWENEGGATAAWSKEEDNNDPFFRELCFKKEVEGSFLCREKTTVCPILQY